ncbi:hypothetical protein ACN267_32210 [Micromonospora sp. WMMD734]|uniref:hypothetical protein n=1 Tax=Micromonospora sp. WMMD734 TaxID=3404129 RepID=UPI003B93E249
MPHTPTPHVHLSEPVQLLTELTRTVVQLEAADGQETYVSVSHWQARFGPSDEPAGAEPDDLVVLDLASAASLAGAIASLIGRELGPPR